MNESFLTSLGSPVAWWLISAAAFTSIACGLPGTFLILRRMSLTGDAISHSVLPGIVIGFLASGSLDSPWIIAGAAISGWLTVMVIEYLHRRRGVREDAATGVVFTAMFAAGVLLLRLFASRVDLDPDCVLFGNLEIAVHGASLRVGDLHVPYIVFTTGAAAVGAMLFTLLFYHRLLSTSFDSTSAGLADQRPALTQSLLLAATAVFVVAAFQTVGAVMSVALLVVPGATALLFSRRLPIVLLIVVIHALLAAFGGFFLAQRMDLNFGASVVIAGALMFLLGAMRLKLLA